MPKLELDLAPTHYDTGQTGNWVAAADVANLSYSVNGPQPTISKYIAYDNLSPANPFIAVTQDGNGNVVYDGGFPKFYNTNAPASGATFADLSASFKYLHNALNFVANPSKVGVGNKEVLVIGDAVSTQSYSVKDTVAASGFGLSLARVCEVAGYNLTIKDADDWGGVVAPTLAELDAYCLVVVMGTVGGPTPGMISDATVTEFLSYREAGNGLILITDHGPVLNSLSEATANDDGFFSSVNRLAVNFGAYFTGNFDRSPVNVGYLRTNYGDHPLYNGMLDSEDIHAQTSESQVVVADLTTYTPGTAPMVDLPGPERYIISTLSVLDDGSTVSERYAYTVGGGEFTAFRQVDGTPLGDTFNTVKRWADLESLITDDTLGTLEGRLLNNGVEVGTFTHDTLNGTQFTWVDPKGHFPIADGDVVVLEVTSPFLYRRSIGVNQLTPFASSEGVLPKLLSSLETGDLEGLPPRDVRVEMLSHIQRFYPAAVPSGPLTYAHSLSIIKSYLAGQL